MNQAGKGDRLDLAMHSASENIKISRCRLLMKNFLGLTTCHVPRKSRTEPRESVLP